MLYVKEKCGIYQAASKETILSEARRLSDNQLRRGAAITSTAAAKEAVGLKLAGLEYELFACLFLDGRHQVLAWQEMFRGTINNNTIYPREIVKEALALNAAAVIFAHNHPSGNIEPSYNDLELTRTLAEILKVINVRVLDHLIVGDEVFSFTEAGYHSA